jgi:hypothetical protein
VYIYYPDPMPISTPHCAWNERRSSVDVETERRCFRYGRIPAWDGNKYCAQHWRMIQTLRPEEAAA